MGQKANESLVGERFHVTKAKGKVPWVSKRAKVRGAGGGKVVRW